MTARPDAIDADPGLAALVLIARRYGVPADADQLRHTAALGSELFSATDLVQSARSIGLKARIASLQTDRLGIEDVVEAEAVIGRIAGCRQNLAAKGSVGVLLRH